MTGGQFSVSKENVCDRQSNVSLDLSGTFTHRTTDMKGNSEQSDVRRNETDS